MGQADGLGWEGLFRSGGVAKEKRGGWEPGKKHTFGAWRRGEIRKVVRQKQTPGNGAPCRRSRACGLRLGQAAGASGTGRRGECRQNYSAEWVVLNYREEAWGWSCSRIRYTKGPLSNATSHMSCVCWRGHMTCTHDRVAALFRIPCRRSHRREGPAGSGPDF